jgi:hypothetical protein
MGAVGLVVNSGCCCTSAVTLEHICCALQHNFTDEQAICRIYPCSMRAHLAVVPLRYEMCYDSTAVSACCRWAPVAGPRRLSLQSNTARPARHFSRQSPFSKQYECSVALYVIERALSWVSAVGGWGALAAHVRVIAERSTKTQFVQRTLMSNDIKKQRQERASEGHTPLKRLFTSGYVHLMTSEDSFVPRASKLTDRHLIARRVGRVGLSCVRVVRPLVR